MPSARKRALHEVDTDNVDTPKEPSLLQRIRNMWQFANLCQWIALFGKAVKLEDVDIADLEAECLKPYSMALQDIGLALLKYLSSHRGLTHELFEEYTRRQYIAKAPDKNPFGNEEAPFKFADLDVFTKIRVLQQMTQLIMMNPDRLREKTEEQKDLDQTNWRIEPYGWDRKDRTYFVLDDNRIYRRSDPPLLPAKPKKNSKKAKAASRASKRRRISAALASDADDTVEDPADGQPPTEIEDDGFGGMKWECVAVTLDEVRQLLSTIQTKDENETILRDQIEGHLVPILEKQEESRKRKQLQREKELLSLEKMAHAKRSSRIAHKIEQHKVEEQTREEERKRRGQEEAARKAEQKLAKMERERDSRLISRERRLKEREARRLQHEEELAQLSEDSRSLGVGAGDTTGAGRMSERRIQAEIERRQQALKEIEDEEDDWMFDCVCGVHGQIDDGTHSVACEQCNVWQHSKCLGITEEEAEKEDFHLVCSSCRRREQAEKEHRPRIIKLKVNRPSLPTASSTQRVPDDSSPPQPSGAAQLVVELQSRPSDAGHPVPPKLASREDAVKENASNGGNSLPHPPQPLGQSPATVANAISGPGSATSISGVGLPVLAPPGANPFSSPHPTLSPPDQSPNKSRAYHSIYEQSSPLASNGHAAPSVSSPTARQPTSGGPNLLAAPASMVSSPLGGTLKTTPPSLFPAGASSAVLSARDQNAVSSPLAPPPQLTPSHREAKQDEKATPLPPSRGGLSPTKHSPPLSQKQLKQANGANGISPSPGMSSLTGASPRPMMILPPGAALSPSPPQQILTPPVKPIEPTRPAQQQNHQGPLHPPTTSS